MSLVALLDIGSTAVGGILVDAKVKGKDKKRGAIFAATVPVTLQQELDKDRFLANVAAATKEVLQKLIKSGHGTPVKVVCFLTAPFYASRTSIIQKSASVKEPFIYSKKLLELWLLEEMKNVPTDHEILESEVLKLSLNGYRVTEPVGQKAQEAEINHYLSVASPKVLSVLRGAISSVIHSKPIQFHSFALVFFRALEQMAVTEQSYLSLEINGELSELSLIWHGALRETVSFPLSENWLIRQLTTTLKTTPEEARSILKVRYAGHIDQVTGKKLDEALLALRPEWITTFREALNRALLNSFLPREIFVLGEASLSSVVKNWLEAETWSNLVLGNNNLKVKIAETDFYGMILNNNYYF